MGLIVGITGKAGSGKDTVAAIVKDWFARRNPSSKVKRYSFADPLKRACSEAFGIPLAEFYDRYLKENVHSVWGRTRRELLIIVGTDLLRDQLDENIWIKRAAQEVDKNDVTIIPDIRFENEVNFLHEQDGIFIEVIRSEEKRDVNTISHKSEAGVDTKTAFRIINNGTMQELEKIVIDFLERELRSIR